MSLFLILMAVGLVGLIMMALPGLNQHGHVGTTHGIHSGGHDLHLGNGHAGHIAGSHAAGQIGHAGHAGTGHAAHAPTASHAAGDGSSGHAGQADAGNTFNPARLIPSPRAVFSFLTLFGAFGFALSSVFPLLSPLFAGLLALLPAWGIEYFAVRPLWNLMFSFQGKPTTPLEQMVLGEATAVTPFRNGRGIVSLEHDGRVVQLSARLPESQAAMPIRVGDTLQIEEVDAEQQRVTVSIK